VIQTLEEWMAENTTPDAAMTYRQFSNYIIGWRNSMPWAYRGMSLSYDRWAESKWDEVQDRDRLKLAWKEGLALRSKAWLDPVDHAWRHRTLEEAADFMLTIRGTLESAGAMSLAILAEQKPELFGVMP
jgi:hypothetical protein